MKKVTPNSILNIDENLFDWKFLFEVAAGWFLEIEKDMSVILGEFKNEELDYKKDYKLWSEVYSPKDELSVFTGIFEDAVKTWNKVHISNISLAEEIELVKALYSDLGYFNIELNRFEVDFKNTPVTIWVNINNIIYSFKDYKEKKEEILFVPPPREPRHQKAIRSAINSWVISTISLNDTEKDKAFLQSILMEEKTSLNRLAALLYDNFTAIGFDSPKAEIIISIK